MALLKIRQLVEKHPGLSFGGIQWDLFNRDSNGLEDSGAVIHRGRNLLLDEDLYIAWLRGPRKIVSRTRPLRRIPGACEVAHE